ncbi:MAG TPA: hypothetical protein VFG04_25620 [Planctomycetaceae bacterium]|nr:hypothetical protein [Planctomycetaceae bacterium]
MSDHEMPLEGATEASAQATAAPVSPSASLKPGHKRLATLAAAFLGLIAIPAYFYWSMVHDENTAAQLQKELKEDGVQVMFSKGEPSHASFSPFSSMTQTVRVVAGSRKVDDALMQRIVGINQDLSLTLNDCPVTDVGLAELENRHNLRWLELRKTMITDEGIKHLRGTDLELLDISTTKVGDAGMAALGELNFPYLRVLSIENLPVTDEGILHLARFKSLEFLSIAGTKVTPTGKRHLKEKLPEVTILGGS